VALVAPWADASDESLAQSPSLAVEGATMTHSVLPIRSPLQRSRVALLTLLALALGYVFVDKFWLSRRVEADHPTAAASTSVVDRLIAVLPFVDMSEKKDQEYFADGMAEEILDLLATIPAIKVIGRTSSFQFKGKNEDLRAIGVKLGVAYVLEGSVRKSGNRVRVAAQLIDSKDGTHRWSGTYDRDMGDVLELQEEIAAGLVRALQITIGADGMQSRHALANPEGYNLYLRGRYALNRYDKDGFDEAARYFEQALELDPTFAWLDRAFGMFDGGLLWILGDPFLDNLKADPRYEMFLRKMNLPNDPRLP
jgi:TolB-like protein